MSKSYDFIKECGVFFITTLKGLVPATRPFGAIMEYKESLYFSTSNTKEVYAQLVKNPAIQIVALKSATREWIRVNGKAIETKDLVMKKEMLKECPALAKHFDSEECEYFALFEVIDMESYLCSDEGKVQLN